MKARKSRWLPMIPLLLGCTSTLSGSGSTQDAALPFVDVTHSEVFDGAIAATDVPPSLDSPLVGWRDTADISRDVLDLDALTDGGTHDAPTDDGLRVPPLDAARPIQHRVIELATAVHADCALMDDGDVWCWGSQAPSLQMPRPAMPNILSPIPPSPVVVPRGSRGLIGMYDGFCTLTNGEEVWCWGGAYSFYHRPPLPITHLLRPVRIEGARGTTLSSGPINEGFACVWQGAEARCWGAHLPAGSFPGSDRPEFTGGGLVARLPLGALGIERPSSVSGLGFVGERTIHRWGDWGATSSVSRGTWELPSRPVQIAMNSPRGSGCYVDAEGAVVCWGLEPPSSTTQVRRVSGLPRALGVAVLYQSTFPNTLGPIFVLGADGSVWELDGPEVPYTMPVHLNIHQRLSAQPLPGRVRTFLRSEGRDVYWMILTEDGVVYHRHMGEGDTWTRFFP